VSILKVEVPPIASSTSLFDPGHDLAIVECYAEQSLHWTSTLKISMACWTATKKLGAAGIRLSSDDLARYLRTKVLCEAKRCDAVFAVCLRNKIQICFLVVHHLQVAVIGTGIRCESREEDQMCCSWIAQGFVDARYKPWGKPDRNACRTLEQRVCGRFPGQQERRTPHEYRSVERLEFILDYVDGVDDAYPLQNEEIMIVPEHDQIEEQDR
jgi:hypothetical protein